MKRKLLSQCQVSFTLIAFIRRGRLPISRFIASLVVVDTSAIFMGLVVLEHANVRDLLEGRSLTHGQLTRGMSVQSFPTDMGLNKRAQGTIAYLQVAVGRQGKSYEG
jgi:hypothetical protein